MKLLASVLLLTGCASTQAPPRFEVRCLAGPNSREFSLCAYFEDGRKPKFCAWGPACAGAQSLYCETCMPYDSDDDLDVDLADVAVYFSTLERE